ncbi:MAG: SctF chaperone SctG [Chlamydiae bacterium]|nr:SctF chaperone SctG [Chlamydiota bacterium]
MSDLTKFKDHFVLLLEAGFIAVNQADEDSATKLFKAAALLNPENTLTQIGFGYLYLHKLELKQASNIFETILKKEPRNEMAKALLGLTLTLSSDELTKGEQILHDTAKGSSDTQIKTLAESALDFVEKFVKKSSPMAPPTKPTKGSMHSQ